NATTTPAIYPLSLHDALPIYFATPDRAVLNDLQRRPVGAKRRHAKAESTLSAARAAESSGYRRRRGRPRWRRGADRRAQEIGRRDRKSTRLNSSHSQISYAVF